MKKPNIFQSLFYTTSAIAKNRKSGVKPSVLRLECLEERRLLSVSPIDDTATNYVEVTPLTSDSSDEVIKTDAQIITEQNAHARKTITVTTLSDTSNATDGKITLREAISYAEEGYMIQFDTSGTIQLSGTQLEIYKSLTINGGGNITIDANQQSRCFYVGSNISATFNGLRIQNGKVDDNGGGIYGGEHSTLTVVNSTISDNIAETSGGGIYGDSYSTISISLSTISGNTASYGSGGGIDGWNSTITVVNSIISGNTASNGSGGGIDGNIGSTITVVNSTISGNTASYSGGGIDGNIGSTITVVNSTISENTASGGGGGISGGNIDSTITVVNSIILGNTASYGGGIYGASDSTITVVDSTISGNTASCYGGGIYGIYPFYLSNSHVSGNTASQISNTEYCYKKENGNWVSIGGLTLYGSSNNYYGKWISPDGRWTKNSYYDEDYYVNYGLPDGFTMPEIPEINIDLTVAVLDSPTERLEREGTLVLDASKSYNASKYYWDLNSDGTYDYSSTSSKLTLCGADYVDDGTLTGAVITWETLQNVYGWKEGRTKTVGLKTVVEGCNENETDSLKSSTAQVTVSVSAMPGYRFEWGTFASDENALLLTNPKREDGTFVANIYDATNDYAVDPLTDVVFPEDWNESWTLEDVEQAINVNLMSPYLNAPLLLVYDGDELVYAYEIDKGENPDMESFAYITAYDLNNLESESGYQIGDRVRHYDENTKEFVDTSYFVEKVFHSTQGFQAYGLVSCYDDANPILAIRGTAGVADILSDLNKYGVGYDQFLSIKDELFEWLDTKEAGTVQVTGHSLGGALTQWIAAGYTAQGGKLASVTTYNATGISTDEAWEFVAENCGQVTHYIQEGDLVSMAGESYIKGTVRFYSCTKGNTENLWGFLNAKHRTFFSTLTDAHVEIMTSEELSDPWFHYDLKAYNDNFVSVSAIGEQAYCRKTVEVMRSNGIDAISKILGTVGNAMSGGVIHGVPQAIVGAIMETTDQVQILRNLKYSLGIDWMMKGVNQELDVVNKTAKCTLIVPGNGTSKEKELEATMYYTEHGLDRIECDLSQYIPDVQGKIILDWTEMDDVNTSVQIYIGNELIEIENVKVTTLNDGLLIENDSWCMQLYNNQCFLGRIVDGVKEIYDSATERFKIANEVVDLGGDIASIVVDVVGDFVCQFLDNGVTELKNLKSHLNSEESQMSQLPLSGVSLIPTSGESTEVVKITDLPADTRLTLFIDKDSEGFDGTAVYQTTVGELVDGAFAWKPENVEAGTYYFYLRVANDEMYPEEFYFGEATEIQTATKLSVTNSNGENNQNVHFGTMVANETATNYVYESFILKNDGNAPLHLTDWTLDGSNNADAFWFLTVDGNGNAVALDDLTLLAGESVTVYVGLNSEYTGNQQNSFTLTATTNDAEMPTVELAGAVIYADEVGKVTVESANEEEPQLVKVLAGQEGAYQVVLNAQPTENVTVYISSSNSSVKTDVSALTFTVENWNAPQTVKISVTGRIPEDSPVFLSHSLVSNDISAMSGALPDVLVVTPSGGELVSRITVNTPDFEAVKISEDATVLNEWSSFNLELWGDEFSTRTFEVTYDANLYMLDQSASSVREGFQIEFGNVKTENGKTTVSVQVIWSGEDVLCDGNRLLVALKFSPIPEENAGAGENRLRGQLTAGESASWGISVGNTEKKMQANSVVYDLNDDGKVDIVDLVQFARSFGKQSINPDANNYTTTAWQSNFDASRDGEVSILDLVLFARNFGFNSTNANQISYADDYVPGVPEMMLLEEGMNLEMLSANVETPELVMVANVTDLAMTAYWYEDEEEDFTEIGKKEEGTDNWKIWE